MQACRFHILAYIGNGIIHLLTHAHFSDLCTKFHFPDLFLFTDGHHFIDRLSGQAWCVIIN